MMDAIGGYFSLELPCHEEYHKDALRLNTGRNCLEYILLARQYTKVYIPYYTCEVILEPFKKLGVAYTFYSINQDFEIADTIRLKTDEAILYTNYYGLKSQYVQKLAAQYGNQLIVDSTQAFFALPVVGVDTFYTCRKYFGVPDGAYLYSDVVLSDDMEQDVSFNHLSFLAKRIDVGAEEGYADFNEHEEKLNGQPIRTMSRLTGRLMRSIDYGAVALQRRTNFIQLHSALASSNELCVELEPDNVPMVYPYLTKRSGLREFLIENRVYVAKYWPNVLAWVHEDSLEHRFATYMLPLPIDQRYGYEQLDFMLHLLLKNN